MASSGSGPRARSVTWTRSNKRSGASKPTPPWASRGTRPRSGLRVIACERHRIFYQNEGETILIVRVLHEAMDATRHL